MGFFFNKLMLNEAEVDGQDQGGESTDYTADADIGDTPDAGTEDTGNDDNADQETTDETDTGDDTAGDDDTTDYTDMGDDDGGDDGTDDSSGDDSGDTGDTGDSGGSDDNADEPVDDLKQKEEELYSDMNPEQLDIRHKELKSQFLAMYDIVVDTLDKIGDASISEDSIHTVEFITEELSRLQAMIADYVNNVYSMKSYIENSINYNRFLTVLNGINKILEEINTARKNSEENDKI